MRPALSTQNGIEPLFERSYLLKKSFTLLPTAVSRPTLESGAPRKARRVRIVVAPIELNNERAAMKDFSGSIRTSIQRQSGGQVVAA